MIPALTLLVSSALAADTGNLRGRITSADGSPVDGASVVLSGPSLGGERVLTTSSDGSFQILALPPGQHRLVVAADGFAPADLSVTVRLDESAFVPVTLDLAGADIELVVTAPLPVIDATRSAVSTELDRVALQGLPVARSYQEAVNIVAGVYGRVDTQDGGPGKGNPSVRGEGQYGNNYLVDGISTRDPADKTFGVDVPFDAIETLQVYTDGAPAEFGQATGMIVNVVTRDGGDEHHGSAAYYVDQTAGFGTYDIAAIDQGREVATDKRRRTQNQLSLTAGGPIVPEKLWYFAAGTLQASNALYEGSNPTAPTIATGGGGFGKLTWFVSNRLTAQLEVTGSSTTTRNSETTPLVSPESQALRRSSSVGTIATVRYTPTLLSEIEAKVSYLPRQYSVEPMSGDVEAPSFRDVDTGRTSGNFTAFDENVRSRLGGTLKATVARNGSTGTHRIKGGVEAWRLLDSRELNYTGPGDGREWWSSPSRGFACEAADGGDCFGYQAYTDVGEPLGHEGHVFGGFLQDDWSPVRPLTANIGARIDREVLYQNEGARVIDAVMPAPRVGLAWDVTDDSKTLLSFNYGRYFDLSGNNFAAWGDTRSNYVYRQFENDGSGNFDLVYAQNPEQDPLVYCTPASLSDWQGHLVKDYGYTVDDAKSSTDAAWEDVCGGKSLRPYHMDKIVLGLKREVLPRLVVGLRGISSLTRDIPEDVNYDYDTWVIANPPNKWREYRALEVVVERKYDEVWQLLGSYTLSASKGHTPGQFERATGGSTGSDGNNVGVYLDDINNRATRDAIALAGGSRTLDGLAGLGRTDDDAGWFGYLPYHSFHQVKISGFYSAPRGTTAGIVYELDSGHAWQRRGYVPGYGDYFAFPEGRGSRFMPVVNYLDVRVGQSFDLRRGREVELVLDVFNVLDLHTPVTYYENDNQSFGLTLYRQAPRSARLGLRGTY